VPVFPEILSRLLSYSKPEVTFAILALDGVPNPSFPQVYSKCVAAFTASEGDPSLSLPQIHSQCVVQHELGDYLKIVAHSHKPLSDFEPVTETLLSVSHLICKVRMIGPILQFAVNMK
jgi:hypothetical protein